METKLQARKYAELRAKTDRQLLSLVDRELRAARASAGAGSTVHPRVRARAEAALATIARILPKLDRLDERQRAELQSEIDELQSELADAEGLREVVCAGRCA